jgi:hypothetical protein
MPLFYQIKYVTAEAPYHVSLPSDFSLKSQNGLISVAPLALAQGVLATS